MIDWECEVIRDYSEINLGAGKRIASGLTSALALLGEAIIIEDDILPHPDFFAFCTEALNRYRNNPKVHGISGYNPVGRWFPGKQCALSTLTHITWGWATWQRAWENYRGQMEAWSEPKTQASIRDYVGDPLYFGELVRSFKAVEERKVDAWDYQWVYTMLYERRHAIVSSVNLIENLGFVADATHTFHVPAFAHNLTPHASPHSPWPSPESVPDRLFDRVAWLIILNGSRLKITLLRLLARSSRWLVARAIKQPAAP
jgi:hypothetical protein